MAKPPFQVKALYDYKSPHEDDLSFPSAQIITVTDEEDNDWYYGEFDDASGTKQEGLFPRNFVKPYEPETPPRPNRQTRAKKETASTSEAADAEKPTSPSDMKQEVSQASASQPLPVMEPEGPQESQEAEPEPKPQPPPSIAIPPPTQTSGQVPPSGATSATRETKPMPPTASKGPPPPPVTEKPASGSFRDRINAFNKSTAPPPAPSKPAGLVGSGGSGFVKKTFVAPPPSKNAYVPPPRQDAPHKVYRREEDPEVVAQSSRNHDEEDVSVPQVQSTQAQSSQDNDSEDQPKPTSLKERIALLQKQQAEQASRHAEKKEKPKRPPKRQEEDLPAPEADHEEEGELERAKSNETTGKKSMDAARDPRASTRPRKSREEAPSENATALPAREILSDGNDADQSGAADTGEEEDQSTGRDDSDDKAPRPAPVLPHRTPQMPNQEIESEGVVREGREGEDEEEEEEEEDEEDVDPEVKRRMEIRERMAKMSGGMGMAGMFGAPGGMPPKPAPRQGTGSSERKMSGTTKSEPAPEASRAPPVPIMPMPGLAKTKSPEVDVATRIEPEVEKEESEEPKSMVHGRAPAEMPDLEDLREEPTPVRRSTDRAPPPPPPSQGNLTLSNPRRLTDRCSSRSSPSSKPEQRRTAFTN